MVFEEYVKWSHVECLTFNWRTNAWSENEIRIMTNSIYPHAGSHDEWKAVTSNCIPIPYRKTIFYHTRRGYLFSGWFWLLFLFLFPVINFIQNKITGNFFISPNHSQKNCCVFAFPRFLCEMQSDKLQFLLIFSLDVRFSRRYPVKIYCFKFLTWIFHFFFFFSKGGMTNNIFIFPDPKKIDYTFINIEFLHEQEKLSHDVVRCSKDFRRITLHKLFIHQNEFYSLLLVSSSWRWCCLVEWGSQQKSMVSNTNEF